MMNHRHRGQSFPIRSWAEPHHAYDHFACLAFYFRLLSTSHLVYLALCDIPRLGYISSEAMVTTLSALTSLETLFLRCLYPQPRPALESRRLPLHRLMRSILPRLTKFIFNGASEYLEGILARIDAPRLNIMYITFFNQIIFNTPRLYQFISQVEWPTRLSGRGSYHIRF